MPKAATPASRISAAISIGLSSVSVTAAQAPPPDRVSGGRGLQVVVLGPTLPDRRTPSRPARCGCTAPVLTVPGVDDVRLPLFEPVAAGYSAVLRLDGDGFPGAGPFQTWLTLKFHVYRVAEDSRYGGWPRALMATTSPANTASASASASVGEPDGAQRHACAGFGRANRATKPSAKTPATVAATRLPRSQ